MIERYFSGLGREYDRNLFSGWDRSMIETYFSGWDREYDRNIL